MKNINTNYCGLSNFRGLSMRSEEEEEEWEETDSEDWEEYEKG